MKKTALFIFIYMFSISMCSLAQSSDEKEVAAAVEKLRTAMIDGDQRTLQAITFEELSYGHSSGKIEDKKSFVETLVTGKSDFKTMDLTEQTITVTGSTALVRHKLYAEINDGGKPGTVSLGVLLVWQKQAGQWKLLARQAFKL